MIGRARRRDGNESQASHREARRTWLRHRFLISPPMVTVGFASSDLSPDCVTSAISIATPAGMPESRSRISCSSLVKPATWATFAGKRRSISMANDDAVRRV